MIEEPDVNTVDVDEDSSSSSSSSSEDSCDLSAKPSTSVAAPVEDSASMADDAILAKCRKVTHAMIKDMTGNPDLPCFQDQHWRPACGVRMLATDAKFLDEWSHDLSFCQHPGCKKAWGAIGMF